MRTGGQAAVFLIADHLGSTNKLVGPYGAPLTGERQLYKPWGEKRLSTSISLTRVGYTGQYEDGYITLYWMNARWYDPALSRWIQPDIIVPLASQGTQAWDRFAYSNNNPIRFNDPSGHDVGCHGEDLSECISQPSPAYWKAAPTSTPAPTNTPPPPSFYSAAPTPEPTQMPYYTEAPKPFITVEVDWSKVDMIDFYVDVGGVAAEAGAVVAAVTGFEPVAAGLEYVQADLELVGFVKSVVDVVGGDPQNLLIQQTSSTAQRYLVLVFRAERAVPIVGLIGNGVSLYTNLRPEITINYR